MRIKIWLLRRSRKEPTECKCVWKGRRLLLISFKVPMGFLSARNAAALPSPERPACSKRITHVVGRDIRTRVEGSRAG